jgi:hypothetical protein
MARNMYRGQGRPCSPRMNMSSAGRGMTPCTSSASSTMLTPLSAGPMPLRFLLQQMTTMNQPHPLFVQVAELWEEIEWLNHMRLELTPSPLDTPIPGPSHRPEVTYCDIAMMRTGGQCPCQGPTTMTMTSPHPTPLSWSTLTTPQSHTQSLGKTRLNLAMSPPMPIQPSTSSMS